MATKKCIKSGAHVKCKLSGVCDYRYSPPCRIKEAVERSDNTAMLQLLSDMKVYINSDEIYQVKNYRNIHDRINEALAQQQHS